MLSLLFSLSTSRFEDWTSSFIMCHIYWDEKRFCKVCCAVFNTSGVDQIEMKTRFPCFCEALLWLWCPRFFPLALQSKPLYGAICTKRPHKVNGMTTPFDASYTVIWRKWQHALTSKYIFIPSKWDNRLIVNALQNILKTRVFRAAGKLFLNSRAVRGHL